MKLLEYMMVVIVVLLQHTNSHNILVMFPFPTKSHTILGDGFVRHLLKDGHEVTYITPLSTPIIAHNKLRYINVNETYNAMPELNIKTMMTGKLSLSVDMVLQLSHNVAHIALNNPEVQTLLLDPTVQFDLVIAEWMFSDLYCGLGAILKCPLIWSSSIDSHWMIRRLMHQPDNPAYTPDYTSTHQPPLNFRQRVDELWTMLSAMFTMYQMQSTVEAVYQEVYSKPATSRDIQLPPYTDVLYNASLMFLNCHISYGSPSAMPQNVKYIGGYHIETPVKPLPENVKKLMDSSKDGVIYFSMGSVLKSSQMSATLKTGLLDIFSKLKQTVIWKFEEKLPAAPANVHIVNWAPQPSILSHPNCVLFITHGGLLSTTEAIHAGVPLIGIPMFADQFQNMERAAAKGFALRINLTEDTPTILMDAIREILTNQSYKNTMKTLSSLYHSRVLPPSSELLFWVDHVITHGAAHLRSAALHLPLYQKLYLDLIIVILVSVVCVYIIIKYIIFNLSSKLNDDYNKKYK